MKNDIKNKVYSNELPFIKEPKHNEHHQKHKNTAEDITDKGDCSPFPWRLISGMLGMLCLLLMVAAILVAIFTANSSSEITSSTIQLKGPHCPKDWIWFRCNCYHFSKEKLTWRESQRTCLSLNSSLIKINTEEMNLFSLKSFFWIGAYYNETGKKWLWKNDLAVSSDLFYHLRPTMYPACLSYKSRDVYLAENCENKQTYICKTHLIIP